MGEEYYKAKYKAAKKELKVVRIQMDEEKETFQIKLDQVERERDELAEKIDQDFRKITKIFSSISVVSLLTRPQNQAVYDFFEQVAMWHSKRDFDTLSTTLPMTAAELRACGRTTASDTARQIAKNVFGTDKMRETGCVSKLDQALVEEILKYTMAKFKLRLSSDEKVVRKGITDACQYERAKFKLSTAKNNDLTSNVVANEQSKETEKRREDSTDDFSLLSTINDVDFTTMQS